MRRHVGLGHVEAPAKRQAAGSSRDIAFLVEAIVLLAATMTCLAVFASLFSRASLVARSANERSHAVELAEDQAEAFGCDPEGASSAERDGLTATSDVTQEQAEAGTLWRDHITVTDEAGETLFELDTSKYVSGRQS